MRAGLAPALLVFSVSASCTPAGEPTAPPQSALRTKEPQVSANTLPLVTVTCGAQISGDARLDNDLTCTGNALVVSGDDITIDLNGHTLSGNGSGNGITVSASHGVRIFGGSVRGFQSGIFVGGSSDVVIRDNEFSATNQAVLFQATTGSVIKHNTVTRNLARAFMLRPNLMGGLSTDNIVIGNVVIDTPTGIYLIRQPGNRILNNTVIGSTVAGVDLADGAGVVSDNIVQANHLLGGGSGIRFSAGWTGNRFVGNRIEANVCGTKGSTAGNTLNGNVFFDNTTDACP